MNILAVVVLILVILNLSVTSRNRVLQKEVQNRAVYINQSVRLNNLNNSIIRSLAQMAVDNQDAQLKALLNENGVTFQITTPEGNSAAEGGER